ncbi:MAG: hypothetical protein HGA85_05880 [Nanoarchaeota archaeon]|nr:hypothetical protein [Nanoarchaeota archaeon]
MTIVHATLTENLGHGYICRTGDDVVTLLNIAESLDCSELPNDQSYLWNNIHISPEGLVMPPKNYLVWHDGRRPYSRFSQELSFSRRNSPSVHMIPLDDGAYYAIIRSADLPELNLARPITGLDIALQTDSGQISQDWSFLCQIGLDPEQVAADICARETSYRHLYRDYAGKNHWMDIALKSRLSNARHHGAILTGESFDVSGSGSYLKSDFCFRLMIYPDASSTNGVEVAWNKEGIDCLMQRALELPIDNSRKLGCLPLQYKTKSIGDGYFI